MTNCANGIQREIKVKGQRLGAVAGFGCLGAVVSDDGSGPGVLSGIARAAAALAGLKPIWRGDDVSLGSKVGLMRSLVVSMFLYACESWTLTAELEKRTQAFEMRCCRRLLNISYKDHVTNEEVRRKTQAAIGEYDELLTLVKKRGLGWFGRVSGSSGLAKTVLRGVHYRKNKELWKNKVVAYSIPKMYNFLDSLGGAVLFSCLDLQSENWQIEDEETDKPKTAFVCIRGLFENNTMPVGLSGASATFSVVWS